MIRGCEAIVGIALAVGLGIGMIAHAASPGIDVVLKDNSGVSTETIRLYSKSHALVIGIDSYRAGWPRLRMARRDARQIAAELKKRNFEVTLKLDVDSFELRESLREFFALRGADPTARLLFWFAGHGHTINGEGFLVPADAPLPRDRAFKIRAMHMRDFGGLVRLAEAKHVLSIFDSCFSGTIFEARSTAAPKPITRKTTRAVRQFITSGDEEQKVSDDGSFRDYFLRALRGEDDADFNYDGYLTGEELGLFLNQRVSSLTNAAQTPKSGKLQDVRFNKGDFVFQLPSQIPTTVAPLPPSHQKHAVELAFWKTIENSNDPSDFQAYLLQFPNGAFASLARNRLRRLGKSTTAALPERSIPSPALRINRLSGLMYVAKSKTVNVRSGPGTDHAIIGTLKGGREVEVTGEVEGRNWVRVAISGGRVGYVFKGLLSEEAPKATPAVGVFTGKNVDDGTKKKRPAGRNLSVRVYGPGITDTEIKIGNTNPYSGPASVYSTIGKVISACFVEVNETGGINGRKINWITYDDGYSPPKTKEQIRKLVERDKVAFTFQTLGTPTNSAIQKYLNRKKVPQLFVASGATRWSQPNKFPWSMGFQPTYQTIGKIFGIYILRNHPNGRIAVLYQNDDYGKSYVAGLKQAMGDKYARMVVKEESYEVTDPTVASQIVSLAYSGADIFVNISIPKFAAQAIRKMDDIGWKPTHLLSDVSASIKTTFEPAGIEKSKGIVSVVYLKDPNDQEWKHDEEMNRWRAFMDKYYPDGDRGNALNVYGWAVCGLMIDTLRRAGHNLSRENIMKSAASLKDVWVRGLLPGIKANTSATDFNPIEQMQMTRFDGNSLIRFGPLVDADAGS